MKLVGEQSRSAKQIAAGLAARPGVGTAFASTQAAWRFFNNDSITTPQLASPLRQVARDELAKSNTLFYLAILDWSKIDYSKHSSKLDRAEFCNPGELGYSLTSVLAVDVFDGSPLGPLEINLEASFGTLTSRHEKPQPSVHYLEQVAPIMDAADQWGILKRPVFAMDREFDSVEHYRKWHGAGHLYLVRADLKRLVKYQGETILLADLVKVLQRSKQFGKPKRIEYKGKSRKQHVAEGRIGSAGLEAQGGRHAQANSRRGVDVAAHRERDSGQSWTSDIDVVVVQQCAQGRDQGDAGSVVLLALEDRDIFQVVEDGGCVHRGMATRDGVRAYPASVGGLHGVCHRLAAGSDA